MLLPYDCSAPTGIHLLDHLSRLHRRHGVEAAYVEPSKRKTTIIETHHETSCNVPNELMIATSSKVDTRYL